MTRVPDAKIVDDDSGNPAVVFTSPARMERRARVQFFGQAPADREVEYAWAADPEDCVVWTDERFTFKRSFRVVANGWLFCTLTDSNGFHYHVPGVPLRCTSAGTETRLD